MLQPQMTGMTIHELTDKLDAGDVVHQCTADLVRGGGIHDLSCRAVEKIGIELVELIKMLVEGETITKKSHKTSGKLWIGKDWRPEHLELVYKFYNDRIVDHYLDGKFSQEEPNLHRQF
jgi:methionyl-tRNA formyltransferase